MIELPESHTLAKQMNELLRGKTIVNVTAGFTPHSFAFFHGDPQGYAALLSGNVIEKAVAYGGHVELFAGSRRILFGDGTGVRFFAPKAKRPHKHQLLVEFEDGSAIACTIQMYGRVLAFAAGEFDQNFYYKVAKEKPSPLTGQFDANYFESLRAQVKENTSIKAFLATEQRIPGLGNGVLQDILFSAGLHPKRKLGTLGDPAYENLFHVVRKTLIQMTNQGGRNTEKDLFENAGGYQAVLCAKTRKNPCPVCAGNIERQAYLGGNVYFCRTCQPLE